MKIQLPKHTYDIPENLLESYQYVEMRTATMPNHGIPDNAPLIGKPQPTKYVMPNGRQVSID